jgi:hypothetical protein
MPPPPPDFAGALTVKVAEVAVEDPAVLAQANE